MTRLSSCLLVLMPILTFLSPSSGLINLLDPLGVFKHKCNKHCQEMRKAISMLTKQYSNLETNIEQGNENWKILTAAIKKDNQDINMLTMNQKSINNKLAMSQSVLSRLSTKMENINLGRLASRIDRLVKDLDQIKSKPGTLDPYLTDQIDEQRKDIKRLLSKANFLKGQLESLGVGHYGNDKLGLGGPLGGDEKISLNLLQSIGGSRRSGKMTDTLLLKTIKRNRRRQKMIDPGRDILAENSKDMDISQVSKE